MWVPAQNPSDGMAEQIDREGQACAIGAVTKAGLQASTQQEVAGGALSAPPLTGSPPSSDADLSPISLELMQPHSILRPRGAWHVKARTRPPRIPDPHHAAERLSAAWPLTCACRKPWLLMTPTLPVLSTPAQSRAFQPSSPLFTLASRLGRLGRPEVGCCCSHQHQHQRLASSAKQVLSSAAGAGA